MNFKKIAKALLYPHMAIMIILVPISVVLLVYSMVCLGSESAVSIISYVLSAYTLTIWCLKIPDLIRFFKNFKNSNKYALIWQNDARLRINVSLYGSLVCNVAYALLQLGLGFIHSTFWFFSLAGYYLSLAVVRFFLVGYTTKHKPGTNIKRELVKFRFCGIVFLVMNLAISLMIFFMVYWNRTFIHHEITTIAMAAYTFTAFTASIVNIVKYRKHNSPVYTASKAINLAAACVSMLTLESTMLTTFDDGSMSLLERKILLASSGGAISVFIIIMAVYMIIQANKKLKLLDAVEE